MHSWAIPFYFLAFLLLFSCSSSSEQQDKQVFRYNESDGITSLDPVFTRNLENMWAVNQLFDGLVELDSAMNVIPSIAKSWQILDSGLTYKFTLRDDVYFHDHEIFPDGLGRKVTAQDFVYSFNRLLDPEIASPGSWVLKQIDLVNGGFEALNDSTFKIILKEPFAPFIGMLSMQYCTVVPHEIADHYGRDFRSNPIGTGPFKFAFWYENVALVYHKNENFWMVDDQGEQLPYLDAVKIDFVRDMSTEFYGLLKGEYDFMSGIHAAYKDELLDPYGNLNSAYDKQIKFQKTAFLKTDYLGILVDPDLSISAEHPLSDVRVRQALNYALNRKEMVAYLRNNSVFPANTGFIPRGLPGYDENATYGYTFNPKKALQLLDDAGYPNGEGLQPIAISTTSDYVDLIEYIQHEWAKIGVEIEVDILPSSTHREQVASSKLIMFRKGWLADYADAENFLGLFYSENYCPNGPNYTHFFNPEFDSLFVEAKRSVNHENRHALYRQMDSLVMSESPVIPLFYDQVSHFVSKKITGLPTNPVNMLDLKSVRKLH